MSEESRRVGATRALLTGLLGLALLVTGLGPATAGPGPPSDEAPTFPAGGVEGRDYVPGELLVRYEPGTPAAARSSKRRRHGLRRLEGLPVPRLERVEVQQGESVLEKAAELSADPSVRYAEPNYIVRPQAVFPNDPRFGTLWGLHNTGQSGGTPDADIDAPEGWELAADTSDIVVGVIDTGIDFNHPDLKDRIWENPDPNGENSNGCINDFNGCDFSRNPPRGSTVFHPPDGDEHGTHVAGTISATTNNGTDVTGVSQAQIMIIKFLGPDGGFISDAVKAIDYAIDNGADITNNSWGGGGFSQSLQDAIGRADAAGQLFVAAAGNNTPGRNRASYPARYPNENIVSVAATTRNDALASFSNYSATQVDLGAPGHQIRSTVPGSPSTAVMSGTSMAAPHVTGAAVHVMARFPSLGHLDVKQRVMDTGDPIPALAGKTVSGNRLNLAGALAGPPAPPTDLVAAAGPGGAIDLSWQASTDPDVAGYRVFRGTSGGFLATPATRISGEAPVPDTAFQDTGTADGVEYFYVVRTVTASGEEGGGSNRVSATADPVPPDVVETQPPDGAPSVAMDTQVTATFSEAMDPATITTGSFTVAPASSPGDPVPATVGYEAATRTATLAPDAVLESNVLHVARLTTEVADVAGNTLPSAFEWSFRTDDLPPVVVIGGPGPNTLISRSAPAIEGTADDDGWVEAVEVAIQDQDDDYWNGQTFGASETWLLADIEPAEGAPSVQWSFSPQRLPPADAETFTILVRARDGAGNRTEPALERPFVVDNVAPRNVTTSAGSRYQRQRVFPVSWRAEDNGGVDSFLVQRRVARFNGGWGSWSTWKETSGASTTAVSQDSANFRGSPGRTYCFRTTATDTANNSRRGSARCTSVPLNNTHLAHRRRWTKRSGVKSAYLGTFSRSTQRGARLVRKGVQAKRLAIVATTCRRCGTIVVKWRGKNIRRISLRSSTTRRRQVIAIKSFPGVRKGTLAVVVTSRGRPVIVEGLATSRV